MEQEERDFEVEPENWETVVMFLRLSTQWRHGFNGPTGLDYTAVESTFRMTGTAATPALFEGLQIMEFAALRTINQKRAS